MKFAPIPAFDRSAWSARLPRRPGPDDPKCPAFRPQKTQPACVCFAFAAAMQSLLDRRRVKVDLDGGELFARIPPEGVGLAPGTVLAEILAGGVGGWTIAGPLYDASIGKPEARFDRAFSAALRRWPLVVATQAPIPPGPDGRFRGWMPLQTMGHAMCAYKPARINGEWALWFRNSQWPARVCIPESELRGAAFYSFRQVRFLR